MWFNKAGIFSSFALGAACDGVKDEKAKDVCSATTWKMKEYIGFAEPCKGRVDRQRQGCSAVFYGGVKVSEERSARSLVGGRRTKKDLKCFGRESAGTPRGQCCGIADPQSCTGVEEIRGKKSPGCGNPSG